MTLHVEATGAGPDLVLLHGWGLHGGLFAPVVPALAARFRVHAVDLPGHGRSAYRGAAGLGAWVDAVAGAVPPGAAWLGWSLGGMLAMHAALASRARISRLVLVASSPRFVAAADWPHAQPADVLERFGRELVGDFRNTVQDFLTLQSLGDERAREQVRALRPLVFAHGDPVPEALADGLDILRTTDLRNDLPLLAVDALVVAGARDRLTPPGASRAIAAAAPRARMVEIAGAAHAPFLTRPTEFVDEVMEFLSD